MVYIAASHERRRRDILVDWDCRASRFLPRAGTTGAWIGTIRLAAAQVLCSSALVMRCSERRYGQETVQILPNGESWVHSRSETVEALDGESREAFLRRLAKECGVGPQDRVRVTYKAGQPKFAVVEWGPVV